MDIFGIGSAIRGAIEIYFRSARQTGRTSALLEMVRDGDTVCFAYEQNAHDFEHLCRKKSIRVRCLVVNPACPEDGLRSVRGHCGQLWFDHTWIEKYYRRAVNDCEHQIVHLQKKYSQRLPVPPTTDMQQREMMKWDYM